MTTPPSFADACAAVCAAGTRFEITEAEVFGRPTKVFAHAPDQPPCALRLGR